MENFKSKNLLKAISCKPKADGGFTLIEIFISIAVIVIIVLVVVSGLRAFRQSADLSRSVDGVIASLRDGRLRTVESKDASIWGVHAESSRVTLFKGAAFSNGAADNVVFNLPSTVTLLWSLQGGGADIKFNRISGDTDQTGTITLRLAADSSKTRIITIRSSGLIEAQ